MTNHPLTELRDVISDLEDQLDMTESDTVEQTGRRFAHLRD